jgi:ABC-2 type transport system ATP-binding protein
VIDVLKKFAQVGGTVLLSSHSMDLIERVCDNVAIIADGRLLAAGKVDDLLGEDTARTRVGVADPDRATTVLTDAGYAVVRDGSDLLVQGHEHPEEITRTLAAEELYVAELSAVRPVLESFFLSRTGHRPRPADRPSAADPSREDEAR